MNHLPHDAKFLCLFLHFSIKLETCYSGQLGECSGNLDEEKKNECSAIKLIMHKETKRKHTMFV